jgi:repressor LexA
MIPLTERQQALLRFLQSQHTCPSFEQMRVALGLNSKSGVHRLVESLERRGYIRRVVGLARAIELVEKPTLPDALTRFTVSDLAAEARRRNLVLGHIHRDEAGKRTFRSVTA